MLSNLKNMTRNFEVITNGNFFNPSYTLEMSSEKKALKQAIKEAKMNNNLTVQIIEVDNDGEILENGYCSETIKL